MKLFGLIAKWCLIFVKILNIFWLCLTLNKFNQVKCNLNIFIKNDGGEIYKEAITSNVTQDLIQLSLVNTDGSFIDQLIDFKNDLQIFKILVLGEQEKNEQIYQAFCFVTSFVNNFISSDALYKLRQRNPSTIRIAEENKGKDIYDMDLNIDVTKSSKLSPHLFNFCTIASKPLKVFANELDLKAWANSKMFGQDILNLLSSVQKMHFIFEPASCKTDELLSFNKLKIGQLCKCNVQICIPWYPCSLKYCKNKDTETNKMVNYRCGIKTCKKCNIFNFYVTERKDCF